MDDGKRPAFVTSSSALVCSREKYLRQVYDVVSWLGFAQGTPSLEELKLMYYRLLIRYHEHNNSYIDICRCYRSIYEVEMHIMLPC